MNGLKEPSQGRIQDEMYCKKLKKYWVATLVHQLKSTLKNQDLPDAS